MFELKLTPAQQTAMGYLSAYWTNRYCTHTRMQPSTIAVLVRVGLAEEAIPAKHALASCWVRLTPAGLKRKDIDNGD